MVERRGAFSEMLQLQKEMNKLFEQLVHFDRAEAGLTPGEWVPSVDVFESEENLVVKVEVPGMSREDVSAVFRGHKLVVSGEKKEPKDNEAVGGYVCMERTFGKFSRTIHIDQAVDLTRASAAMQHGVLTITMPMLKDRRGSEIRLTIQDGK
jgi:HSP20 family protein